MNKTAILHQAIEALKDCHQEAHSCGQPVVDILIGILSSIQSTTRLQNTAKRCLMLKEQANEAISTYPYSEVPDHWRRLYMDATLLHVVSILLNDTPLKEADLLELVRLLDMANIVTAYFQKGREEVLFSLLTLVQSELPLPNNEHPPEPPFKKRRKHGKSPVEPSPLPSPLLSSKPTLLLGIKTIKTYTQDEAPDMTDLSSRTQPFIVKGGISDWPAVSSTGTRWSDPAYLLKIAGRGRIVPVEIGSSYTAEGWSQQMLSFEDFLIKIKWDDAIGSAESDNHGLPNGDTQEPILYLAQHDLFQQFPELAADIIVPDYVFADPGPPEYFPDYQPPNVASGYTKNAWMGPKNTYSPAHTDPYYNCYAQVVGSKHIWIAPPECSPIMEGSASKEKSDEDEHEHDDDRNAAAQQFMDNTAQIDVFEASTKQEDKQEDTCTPQGVLFRNEVVPLAQQAILEAGDLLFMPPKWWHSLKSLERSFSVSMWF